MKIVIKLKKTQDKAKEITELFKKVENLAKEYDFIADVDIT